VESPTVERPRHDPDPDAGSGRKLSKVDFDPDTDPKKIITDPQHYPYAQPVRNRRGSGMFNPSRRQVSHQSQLVSKR